jgi:hypothetical protein
MSTTSTYTGRCVTCRHWGGDREKTLHDAEKSGGKSMDLDTGWPESGTCGEGVKWLNYDYEHRIEVAGSFGCVYYRDRRSRS